MLKKAILLLLVCLLALPLFACGETPPPANDGTTPPTEDTPGSTNKPQDESVLNKVYDWNFLTADGLDKNKMTEDEITAQKELGTLYWEITNGGTLYLKGICTQAPVFYDEEDQPWRDFTTLQSNDAGDGRPALKHVIIEPTVMALPESAFKNCAELETVTLSMTISTLPAYCFAGCEALTTVTGGIGLASIGEYALSNCSKLQRLEFTEALTEVGRCAFDGSCDRLGSDEVTGEVKTLLIYYRGDEAAWLAHKEILTVNAIGNAAFESAKALYVNN